MNGKNKKTPYAIFLVVICLLLAGCSGGSGGGAQSTSPEESTNLAADLAETTTPTKMEKIKTMAESRGMTMGDLKDAAESMGMSVEEMMDMGESMGMSVEEMIDMAESMRMRQTMDMGAPPDYSQNTGPPLVDHSQYLEANQQNAQPDIDPANPPKLATSNFIDLDPYVRITKIRAAYGHNYNYGSADHDPTGKSCSSMKHYFDAYTEQQRWDSNFGSYDTRGVVKFYSPVDGNMYQLIPKEIEQGTEYQFYIGPTGYSQLVFTFHHVDLLDEFIAAGGGSVAAGQHIGYIMRPNGQGEIAVAVSNGAETEYISFFDVMSDEVFAEYQARGITSRAQMTISREEREANPIPCTLNDGSGGKFYSESGDEKSFQEWQNGSDNWVELTR